MIWHVQIAIFFSRVSSQPRDQTQVCRIAGIFLTIWATKEALYKILKTPPKKLLELINEFKSSRIQSLCKNQLCFYLLTVNYLKKK